MGIPLLVRGETSKCCSGVQCDQRLVQREAVDGVCVSWPDAIEFPLLGTSKLGPSDIGQRCQLIENARVINILILYSNV